METKESVDKVERERKGSDAAVDEDKEYCPQCGRILQPHKCKLVCECGYFMSCSEF